MAYAHIENLYRPEAQVILLFRECYAMEKIHGTSAHVRWSDGVVSFFAGGEKHDAFVALFSPDLTTKFALSGQAAVTVYGEAYGGRCQGMKDTYGDRLRFVAFDVLIGERWLSVPQAEQFVNGLGLEFVHYAKVLTDLASLDAERDRPSEQAKRNGIIGDRKAEGVVLRPLVEVTTNNGSRICAKHKRADFAERKNPPPVDPGALAVMEGAQKIADEWVTEMRLTHVLDKMGNPREMSATGAVIKAMVEDVLREGSGEFVETKEVRSAIGAAAAKMFKARVRAVAVGKEPA